MYKSLPRLMVATLLAVGIIWLGARITTQERPASPAIESEPSIRLGSYTGVFSALIWVAEGQGFFADQHLNVTLSEYTSGVTPVQALVRGEVDLATAAEFVLVGQSFDQPDLRSLPRLTSRMPSK